MNLFEIATREQYRFESTKGVLTLEDLWVLPLTARNNGVCLDAVAKQLNSQLKNSEEESFVTQKTSADTTLSNKLELVKYIISVKLAEQAQSKLQADKKAEKDKLLDILARKRDQSLENLSEEELVARLQSLS